MDLSSPKISDEDRLSLCKRYFLLGCLFLPFLWAVNAVWFFPQAFYRKPEFPQQKTIRKLVIASAVGSLVYLVAFIAWVAVFYTHRAQWGPLADRISFNIPTGTA